MNDFQLQDLAPLLPEIIIAGMACLILVVDLYVSAQRRGLIHLASLLSLAFAAIVILQGDLSQATEVTYALNDTFVRDPMSDALKVFVLIVMGLVFSYSRDYLSQRGLFRGEFYVLCLFGTLGMMVMISAASFLSLYLGLELLALSSYALVALQRDSSMAAEAAMKYFVLGALASGMLLYGISMIYGATGTLQLDEVASRAATLSSDDLVLAFGLTFVIVGLAFKLGAVPFHMWLPDVYQGSPTAVTLFLGSAPKIAAFAMAIRLLDQGLGTLHPHWGAMLTVLAVLSLGIGNVVAIAQTNLKRMLAYSTISHVGFLLLGILAGTAQGYASAMFYVIAYALMSAAAFGMIILLSRAGFEADSLDDFKGLNQRSPWFAGIMLAVMASLAGFPPFLGFWAKLLVLQAAVDAGLIWLAVVAVVFAVIGAFYYLRVIKLMYMDDPEDNEAVAAPMELRAMLSINGLALLLLGLYVEPLSRLCVAAFSG